MPHLVKLSEYCFARLGLLGPFREQPYPAEHTEVDTLSILAIALRNSPNVYNISAMAFSCAGRPRGVLRVN